MITVTVLEGVTPMSRLHSSFRLEPQPGILAGMSFSLPPGLLVLKRPGGFLLGPLSELQLAASEPTPCHSGHQVETLSLRLPSDRLTAVLPPDSVIGGTGFRYTSRWSRSGATLTVRRELEAHFETAICAGAVRQQAAEALQAIRLEQQTQIALDID